MPSTKLKNVLYRTALPFCTPSPGPDPMQPAEGHPLLSPRGLARIIRRHHVFGGAVLVSDGGRRSLILEKPSSCGQAASSDTYFRVASITKMATSLLCVLLSHDGLLDLNAPVTEYLPDSAGIPDLAGVTLIHLLSHTSGLSDKPDLETLLESGAPYVDAVSGARFAEPGSSFRYSNLGFGLIGCVFESVTGLPLGELFTSRIFAPLGMHASMEGCSLPEERIMPVIRLLPFRPDKKLTVTPLGRIPLTSPDPLHHYGHTAGSMYSDIFSLYKLLVCIRDGGAPLLSGSGTSLMKEVHASYGALSPALSYGLGLLVINDPNLSSCRIFGHQGFAYGCADGAFWEEDTGRIMIILNGSCSESRQGRLGLCNRDMLRWSLKKELPQW